MPEFPKKEEMSLFRAFAILGIGAGTALFLWWCFIYTTSSALRAAGIIGKC